MKDDKWRAKTSKKRAKTISFRVNLDEMKDLSLEADRRRVSVSDLVRQALEKMFGPNRSG